MTRDQVDLVQDSVAIAARDADGAAQLFYDNLFRLDPSLRPLFKGDMNAQRGKLMAALGLVMKNLRTPDRFRGALIQLGENHVGYGLTEAHYDTVGRALIMTLEQALGRDFTPALRTAWIAAYGAVAGIMTEAAREKPLKDQDIFLYWFLKSMERATADRG